MNVYFLGAISNNMHLWVYQYGEIAPISYVVSGFWLYRLGAISDFVLPTNEDDGIIVNFLLTVCSLV